MAACGVTISKSKHFIEKHGGVFLEKTFKISRQSKGDRLVMDQTVPLKPYITIDGEEREYSFTNDFGARSTPGWISLGEFEQ